MQKARTAVAQTVRLTLIGQILQTGFQERDPFGREEGITIGARDMEPDRHRQHQGIDQRDGSGEQADRDEKAATELHHGQQWREEPARIDTEALDKTRLGHGRDDLGPTLDHQQPADDQPESQPARWLRSEEHTSELQSLMCTQYAVFCLKKNITTPQATTIL